MKWAGRVARIVKVRKANKVFAGNPVGKRPDHFVYLKEPRFFLTIHRTQTGSIPGWLPSGIDPCPPVTVHACRWQLAHAVHYRWWPDFLTQ